MMNRFSILILGLTLLCFRLTALGGDAETLSAGSTPTTEPTIDYQYNCAINVVGITLHLQHMGVNLQSIGAEMRAGDAFERICSMADIKRVLESRGLNVEGLKFGKPEDLFSIAAPGAVLIVRAMGDKVLPQSGHFGVVLGGSDHLVLVDWPLPIRKITRAQIGTDGWFNHATGEFLLVTGSKAESGDAPKFILPANVLDLGKIPDTAKEIVGQFAIKNDGGQNLKITKVTGPCSCFLGASGDLDIAPHSSGMVTIKFEREKMPGGRLERQLLIETNDPITPHALLTVKMELGELKIDPAEPRMLPEAITWGRASPQLIQGKPFDVTIVLPLEVDGTPSKITADSSSGEIAVVQKIDDEFREADQTLTRNVKYTVSWKQLPKDGAFHEEIHFSVDRGSRGVLKFTVPLSGDAHDLK